MPQAHRGRPGQVLFPRQDHHPLHRHRPRPGDAGGVPRLYPGLSILPGWVLSTVRCGPRAVDLLVQQGIASCKDSGYQEMTLSSLSTSDYRPLTELCDGLLEYCDPRNISLSPALPAGGQLLHGHDAATAAGAQDAASPLPPRRAPSACGTPSTRTSRRKTCYSPAAPPSPGGCSAVKLYFMLGLPTETDEDVLGIARSGARRCTGRWREITPSTSSRGVRITVSTSCFVPKPHTAIPVGGADLRERSTSGGWTCCGRLHQEQVHHRTTGTTPETSYIWRRCWLVATGGWGSCWKRSGARVGRLDSWSEYFSFERWMEAFAETAASTQISTPCGSARKDEMLPWSMIDIWRSPGIPVAGTGAGISLGHHAGLPSAVYGLRRQLPAAGRRVL